MLIKRLDTVKNAGLMMDARMSKLRRVPEASVTYVSVPAAHQAILLEGVGTPPMRLLQCID